MGSAVVTVEAGYAFKEAPVLHAPVGSTTGIVAAELDIGLAVFQPDDIG